MITRSEKALMIGSALLGLLRLSNAFSGIALPRTDMGRSLPQQQQSQAADVTTTTSSWRVVLDIGREPLSNMPFDWARSGSRFPLKIPCDFIGTTTTTQDATRTTTSFTVSPQSDTVSFTGPNGAVIRPIQGGGDYQISKDETELTFSLTFPETLARRDVTIDAGSTIQCTGRLYTQKELDQLYQAYYDARDEAWKLGGELNDMERMDGPPKKWNEETKQWEIRRKSINPLTWAQKRLAYAAAKAKQESKNNQRPDPNRLSEKGSLPGIDDSVYVAKEGVVRAPNGAVMGRWSMEPILSY